MGSHTNVTFVVPSSLGSVPYQVRTKRRPPEDGGIDAIALDTAGGGPAFGAVLALALSSAESAQ